MLDVVLCDGPAPPGGAGRTVNVWRDDDGQVFAEAVVDGDGYRIDWRGVGTLTFTPGTLQAQLWPAADVPASAALSAARRIVQPVVLQALGRQTLHASAIRLTSGVIAFCGVSGSGKSTLACALGQRPGVVQIADDAVVMDVGPKRVDVMPLPFRERLRPESRAFLGSRPSTPSDAVPTLDAAPLLAVFTLGQTPSLGSPRLDRIPAPSAFSALLAHAHCFDDADRVAMTRMVEAYLSLAEIVPVYRLTYSPRFSQLSALQDCVLKAVMAPPVPPVDAAIK